MFLFKSAKVNNKAYFYQVYVILSFQHDDCNPMLESFDLMVKTERTKLTRVQKTD